MLVDDEHRIHYVNNVVRQYIQDGSESIIGGYCPKVIHNYYGPFPGCPLEESVKLGTAVEREIFDPELKMWLTSSIYPTKLRSPDGHVIYFHTVYDITARKNAEEEIKKKQEEILELNMTLDQRVKDRTNEIEKLLVQKDEFLHLLAHDLKNPLSSPLNLLPILEEKIIDEKQKQMVQVTLRSIRTIKRLITDTLKLACLNDTNTELHRSLFSLYDSVESVIHTNKDLFDLHDFTVKNSIKPGFMINADSFLFDEVLGNLFSNAVKYASPQQKGILEINADKQENEIILSVKDNGTGLTREQLDSVFQRFYKREDHKNQIESTGLGLSICKSIIEKHGGRIWVESEGLGKGCTFYVMIPVKNNHFNDLCCSLKTKG